MMEVMNMHNVRWSDYGSGSVSRGDYEISVTQFGYINATPTEVIEDSFIPEWSEM